MSEALEQLKAAMPQSEHGNFYIKDEIGVPHPYCVGTKHVVVAAEQFGGMLGTEAIKAAEKQGAHCCMRGCTLSYEDHEQAVLIGCNIKTTDADGKAVPELHAYLLALKPLVEAGNAFVGFAFVEAFS